MIETMKYINLMGPIDDLERVADTYIAKYDIHLENALTELAGTGTVKPLDSDNPYAEIIRKAEVFMKIQDISGERSFDISKERASRIIDTAYSFYERREAAINNLEEKKAAINDILQKIEPFTGLELNFEDLLKFKYIHFRFGKMPTNNYKQFEHFLSDDSEIIFISGKSDSSYIWGLYFTPDVFQEKADSIFSSLLFERVFLPEGIDGHTFHGSLKSVYNDLKKMTGDLQEKINRMNEEILNAVDINKNELSAACRTIAGHHFYYNAKKFAAKTSKDFFIFVGWMTATDAKNLADELANDKKVILLMEENKFSSLNKPPTKLKNPPIVNFFEFFVRMYGLPSYGELDPTPLLALTYTVLFGAMFGDVGQGAVIALLGLYLYKFKKLALGAIMSVIGISSMFFGFMYGSIFGYEDIIPDIWMRPFEDSLNTLILAVAVGMFLIFVSMAVNIVNSVMKKNWSALLFGANGLPGIIFYAAAVLAAFSILNGNMELKPWFIIVFIAVPLMLIALNEPLTRLLEGGKKLISDSPPLFILQTVIELFELLLSFFSNTVSFARVGAFALSHAGMMSVVIMLSKSANGGSNLMVIILGNLLVMGLEGLIVGIQVLRLEFYEMFSRFYEGGGREFTPYKIHSK